MKIYLMRHGEAAFNTRNDDDRELTDNGRAKIRSNILLKKSELASVQLLLSSPIRRAKQTAVEVGNLLERTDVIQDVGWLIHESQPLKSIAALSRITADSVMLFSHQPFASRFAEILCNLELGAIAMNTASIVAIEADPVAAGFGKILWQLP
jgi:phosphohistidine phosphatase